MLIQHSIYLGKVLSECSELFGNMYNLDRAEFKDKIEMNNIETVKCLLDFSKGAEAVVMVVNGVEEAPNYTILEADRKPSPNSEQQPHRPTSPTIPPLENHITIATTISTNSIHKTSSKSRVICSFCGKSFSHLGDHKKHRRRHTGEQPYHCDLCPKRFAHVSNLVRHRRVHSGEKPFECTYCLRKFSRKDKLMEHASRKSCCKNEVPTGTTII